MEPERVLLGLMVVATGYNVLEAVLVRRSNRRRDMVLSRVDGFLTVWAVMWGEPVAEVKAALRAVLRRYPPPTQTPE